MRQEPVPILRSGRERLQLGFPRTSERGNPSCSRSRPDRRIGTGSCRIRIHSAAGPGRARAGGGDGCETSTAIRANPPGFGGGSAFARSSRAGPSRDRARAQGKRPGAGPDAFGRHGRVGYGAGAEIRASQAGPPSASSGSRRTPGPGRNRARAPDSEGLRPGALSQGFQQASRRVLEHVDHALDPLRPPVVGIRHFLVGKAPRVGHHQLQFVAGRWPRHVRENRVVFPVHGKDQIEALEIGRLELSRAQSAEIVAALGRRFLSPGVGRLSDMVSVRAGGIGGHRHRHPCIGGQLSKNRLGGRRAADVSRANEQYAKLVTGHRWSQPFKIRFFSAEHAPVRYILALLSAALLALEPSAGLAQDWPSKPIRVVIPFAAGSVSEAIFRTISPGVEANLGQRFVVESKPGADGAIGTGEVVRAAPDGYTLLLGPTAVYAVTPHMFRNLGFDPLTALDPISLLADAPLLAVIGTNVPAKSLKELAEYVSANPGKFNYGSPGSGSPAHLTGAAFSQQTGNSMVYVPYKGTPPMVQALLAGDIQVAFPTLTGIIGPVKAGKLRVLAVMARRRMAELPDVPTTLEAGFSQLVGGNWWRS